MVVAVVESVESIGGGVAAVRGTVEALDREKVEEGSCGFCVGSLDCGIKSEREGKMKGFKKTLESTSAVRFLSPLWCSMLQSN